MQLLAIAVGKGILHGSRALVSAFALPLFHLAINFLNAFIVSKAPGYGGTPIAPLSFLWCARPRLSWLAIILIAIRPNDALYFSCAISSLTVEIIL
jgi:hypothetical protein